MSIVIVPKHDDSTRRLIVLIGEWSIQKSHKSQTKTDLLRNSAFLPQLKSIRKITESQENL